MRTKQESYWSRRGVEKKYSNTRSWLVVVNLFRKYVSPSSSILELGPNTGLTLRKLWEAGFYNLAGIDINPDAVRAIPYKYPVLKDIPVWTGSIPEVLPDLPNFDVIFSKATLCHLPYEYDWVLKVIAEKARTHILTVENEKSTIKANPDNRHFPRGYLSIFQSHGWKQIKQIEPVPYIKSRYTARLFAKI